MWLVENRNCTSTRKISLKHNVIGIITSHELILLEGDAGNMDAAKLHQHSTVLPIMQMFQLYQNF